MGTTATIARVEHARRHGTTACVVIPDDLARALVAHKRRTWREIPGVGAGYCAPWPADLRGAVDEIIETARAAGVLSGEHLDAWLVGESGLRWMDNGPSGEGWEARAAYQAESVEILHRRHGGLLVATPRCFGRGGIDG